MKEKWKEIEGFENYEVSNTGRVRNKETKHVLKSWLINSGYYVTSLRKEGKGVNNLIHRLVALTFLEQEEGKNIVNHIDNNKLNNCVDNLEWVDHKGNIAHANNQGRLDTQTARDSLKRVVYKKVYQKDLEGNIIKTWDSPSQAEKESNKYFSSAKISAVASGDRRHHRNYIWEYVDKDSTRGKRMAIDMYDLEGKLLHERLAMREVIRILGMNNQRTLRDKLRKTDDFVEYKGYKFKNSN